ncbi:MAG: hypothetical protein WC315_00255 [Candidatus Omnitrophota bacterium]
MNRRDFFESRVRPVRPLTKLEVQKKAERFAKKYLKEQGLIGPKLPTMWKVDIGEKEPLIVTALTRSDARSEIKKELGVKKLPVGLKIEKVVYEPPIYRQIKGS